MSNRGHANQIENFLKIGQQKLKTKKPFKYWKIFKYCLPLPIIENIEKKFLTKQARNFSPQHRSLVIVFRCLPQRRNPSKLYVSPLEYKKLKTRKKL